jgi:ABC-type proline/glycine betaine transport system permease subunit
MRVEIVVRAAAILGLFLGAYLGIWFGWDTFLVRLGLPSLDWLQALGALVLFFLIFGAVYLLKETSE